MDPSRVELRPEQLLEHAAWLRRLAGTLVLDAARADDVTQQTLLEALQRAPSRVDHPRAWLATTARNFARAFGRGEARRERTERGAAKPEAGPAADEVVEKTAQHHQVVGAVLALAEPYRTTVLLRFFENLKPGAIAKRTGVPVETVRTRLRRGLELLRAELVQRKGNWAAVLVGLIEPRVHAAASRLLLAKAGVAGGIAGGVAGGIAMSLKAKVAIGVVVVACALVAILELRTPPMVRPRDASAESKPGAGASAEPADIAPVAAARRTDPEREARARTIVARILNESGAPIAGARVGVASAPESAGDDARKQRFSFVDGLVATTSADGEGAIVLDETRAKRIVDVAALADGFIPGSWANARAGDEIAITLARTGVLTGVVRDLAGNAVEGALVRAVLAGPRRFETSATSAADGSYRLDGFLGGLMRFGDDQVAGSWMTISADGFATSHLQGWECAREQKDGSFRLDPWLVRGASVKGRVLDALAGTPIEGADVWIRWFDSRVGSTELSTKSATDGSFCLERVPSWGVQVDGQYSPDLNRRELGGLCATARGRGCDSLSLATPDEGAQVDVVLRLAPIGSVRGRVVDQAGRPVTGAWVGASGRPAIGFDWRDEISGRPFVRTSTDENGIYELHDLALADGPGTRVPINARFESGSFASSEEKQLVVTLEAGRVVAAPDVVLELIPGLLVHVVDEAGRSVERAVVDKWNRTAGGTTHDDGVMMNVKTSAVGRCFIPLAKSRSAAPRDTFVSVRAVGFAPVDQDLASETGVVTIALAPEHHLHGWIRDSDGRAGGADVVVVPTSEEPDDFAGSLRSGEFWKRPDAISIYDSVEIGKGRFLIRGLGPGPWHVAAVREFHDGTRTVVVVPDVTDERADVEIVVPRSAERNPATDSAGLGEERGVGEVDVTLTFAESGKPVLRAGYLAVYVGSRELSARATAPGRFRFERVPAGAAELRIDVPGGARETRPIVVTAGGTTTLSVAVATGLVARGRVALAGVEGIRAGSVRLGSTDGGGSVGSDLRADGSYEVAGLVRGATYRLVVSVQGVDSSSNTWISDGSSRTAEEWASTSSPTLVAAGWFCVRSLDRGPPFPAGTTFRLLDVAGHDAYVLTFHGRADNWGDVVATGKHTARLEIPGRPVQEQSTTISPSNVTYFDFDTR